MENNGKSLSNPSLNQSSNTKISYFTKIRDLTIEEMEELLLWIDKYELSRPSKKLSRDFSDGLLIAEILKQLYPKIVEIHNYQSCSSFNLKMENWNTLNRKILRKINSPVNYKTMELLSKGIPGVIESLLHDIMVKYRIYLETSRDSSEELSDEYENTDIMTINVQKKIDHVVKDVPQKMIMYSLYEKVEDALREKNQAVAILNQKVEHLENVVKIKQQRIDELVARSAKREKRLSHVESVDVMKQHMDINSLLFDTVVADIDRGITNY